MSVLEAVTPPADVVLSARRLTKIYGKGDTAVTALNNIDVEIGRGEFTAIMGPSGSGKSTLMHCLAGLDSISEGEIILDDLTISTMSERKLTRLRRDKIGFIFQSFNLIPTLTAQENITLPADISKKKVPADRFNQVVDAIGLRDRLTHRPAELSGGQQQRVACARALVTEPAVVFADEPTGNLDSKSGLQVLKFLRRAVDEFSQTVVMVTHDPDAAAWADRVLFLVDGAVVAQLTSPKRDTILDALRELGGHGTAPSDDHDAGAPLPSSSTPSPSAAQVPVPSAPEVHLEADVSSEHVRATAGTPSAPHTPERAPASELTTGDPAPDATTPMPGETLEETLRRIAPARPLDPETESMLDQARRILNGLPGPVVPADESDFTGQIPIVRQTRTSAEPDDDYREHTRD